MLCTASMISLSAAAGTCSRRLHLAARLHLCEKRNSGNSLLPLQELLLSYGESYWPVEGSKLRRKHEAYAIRAAQVLCGKG